MHVCVIGAGRLGAPYGVSLARMGHEVLLVDTNPATAEAINAGDAPFGEPGLAAAISAEVAAGRLRATSSYAEATNHAGVHILCIGTPQRPDSPAADLRDLQAAFDALLHHTRRTTVILGKSSVPMGTAETLARRAQTTCRHLVEVAWSPDFLRESTSLVDTARPDRIILGLPAGSTIAEPALRVLWAPLLDTGVPLIVTNTSSAELAKYAANTYLATKTSFINMIAAIADRCGADIRAISHTLALDPRIGPAALQPGIGWGGSCFPKDLRALSTRARELGLDQQVRLLDQVDALNHDARTQVIRLTQDTCGGSVDGRRVAVLGCAFKPGCDDISASPALAVSTELRRLGAHVTCHDPAAMPAAARQHPELAYASTPIAALERADVVLHLTDWPEYRQLDPAELINLVRWPHLIDGRLSLDRGAWQAAGWTYRAVGHGQPEQPATTASAGPGGFAQRGNDCRRPLWSTATQIFPILP